MPDRHTSGSLISSLFARERRKIPHPCQLERVHYLDNRSKRGLPIRLQSQGSLLCLGKIADCVFQLVHFHCTTIQLEGIGGIDSDNGVFQFRRRFCRGFRFRQIDLYLWLVLFECSRDHKKDEQDSEDIDERNDNDRRRATFPNCEIHSIPVRSLTLAFAHSCARTAIPPADRARNNTSRSIPPPAFRFQPTSLRPFSKNS